MARKPAAAQTTAVANWDEELAAQAKVAAESQRSTGAGGKFFSIKAGVLTYDDAPLPGNQMAVVILAATLENSYYEGAYNPDVKASPKCFAFAQNEDDLEPHKAVDNDEYFERQAPVCNGCPRNEWGSAEVGKGKACKNVMRLAMIPAGVYKKVGSGRNAAVELEMFEDEDIFAKAEVAYMKLPVMSVKNYGQYVKALAGETNRPPHGVFTNVWVEPDPKSQFKVMFEFLDLVPSELLGTIMPRHKAELSSIDFPYTPPQVDEAPAPARANNKLKRPAAKR